MRKPRSSPRKKLLYPNRLDPLRLLGLLALTAAQLGCATVVERMAIGPRKAPVPTTSIWVDHSVDDLFQRYASKRLSRELPTGSFSLNSAPNQEQLGIYMIDRSKTDPGTEIIGPYEALYDPQFDALFIDAQIAHDMIGDWFEFWADRIGGDELFAFIIRHELGHRALHRYAPGPINGKEVRHFDPFDPSPLQKREVDADQWAAEAYLLEVADKGYDTNRMLSDILRIGQMGMVAHLGERGVPPVDISSQHPSWLARVYDLYAYLAKDSRLSPDVRKALADYASWLAVSIPQIYAHLRAVIRLPPRTQLSRIDRCQRNDQLIVSTNSIPQRGWEHPELKIFAIPYGDILVRQDGLIEREVSDRTLVPPFDDVELNVGRVFCLSEGRLLTEDASILSRSLFANVTTFERTSLLLSRHGATEVRWETSRNTKTPAALAFAGEVRLSWLQPGQPIRIQRYEFDSSFATSMIATTVPQETVVPANSEISNIIVRDHAVLVVSTTDLNVSVVEYCDGIGAREVFTGTSEQFKAEALNHGLVVLLESKSGALTYDIMDVETGTDWDAPIRHRCDLSLVPGLFDAAQWFTGIYAHHSELSLSARYVRESWLGIDHTAGQFVDLTNCRYVSAAATLRSFYVFDISAKE